MIPGSGLSLRLLPRRIAAAFLPVVRGELALPCGAEAFLAALERTACVPAQADGGLDSGFAVVSRSAGSVGLSRRSRFAALRRGPDRILVRAADADGGSTARFRASWWARTAHRLALCVCAGAAIAAFGPGLADRMGFDAAGLLRPSPAALAGLAAALVAWPFVLAALDKPGVLAGLEPLFDSACREALRAGGGAEGPGA